MADNSGGPPAALVATDRLLGTVADVRPEERRLASGAFITLFGFMAGHALLETARDALFLSRWPASRLPWVYLAIALAALALMRLEPRTLRRFSSGHELSAWLVLSAIVTSALWALSEWEGRWVASAIYVWTGVLATLVVVRFWTVLGSVVTVTQAKRLFAVIGSGSVLGAIVGSGLARLLTAALPARHLVLVAAGVFLVSSFGPRLIQVAATAGTAGSDASATRWDPAAVARIVWSRPYLRRVAVLILLATVTFTLVDFVFKSAVDRTIPAEAMGRFFSTVYLGLNILSLGVQVVLLSALFRRLGVTGVLAAVPVLFIAGSVGYVVLGGIGMALLMKGADGSLRYSLYRTSTELLFVPVAVDVRGRVKAFIDVLGQRGGQALGSLLILLALAVAGSDAGVALLAAVTAAGWLILALGLRPHYLNVFRETLSRDITETRVAFPALDLASLESLLATLNDPDDRKVRAALDLLASQGKARVIPALILYHPSAEVVVHAVDLLLAAGREDILPIIDRLRHHADGRIAAAALYARIVLRPGETDLRLALRHPAPEVAATALVGLIAGGWMVGSTAAHALETMVTEGSGAARIALAIAIRRQPGAAFVGALHRLATIEDPDLEAEVLRAMAMVKSPAFVPALMAWLARRSRREAARTALVAIGGPALSRLEAALEDATIPHGVRRHLPATIARFGTARAAQALLRHLLHETDGMIRFKVLRAVGRLQSEHPEIPLDGAVLEQAFRYTLDSAFRAMRWRTALEGGAAAVPERRTAALDLLVALLRDKESHAVERLFRLLNLLTHDEDFARIHRGLSSRDAAARAGSRELAEHLLPAAVRAEVLVLLDDLYGPGTGAAEVDDDSEPLEYRNAIEQLIDSGVESLSALAVAHVGQARLHTLVPALIERPDFSDLHRDVLTHALEALRGPAGGPRA